MATDEEKARNEVRKAKELRRAAIMLAENKHGNDEGIIELKHAIDDAQLAEKKFRDNLSRIRLNTQLARAKYERALDKFVDSDYQLSDKEWDTLIARFTHG